MRKQMYTGRISFVVMLMKHAFAQSSGAAITGAWRIEEADGQLENRAWHHSGQSSKGDPIYEIWSRVK